MNVCICKSSHMLQDFFLIHHVLMLFYEAWFVNGLVY